MEWVDSRETLVPKTERERLIFAEEALRVDTQVLIQRLLDEKGLTRKDLAQKLGVSQARVSQYFADDCNLRLSTIAQIFFALGETPSIVATPECAQDPAQEWVHGMDLSSAVFLSPRAHKRYAVEEYMTVASADAKPPDAPLARQPVKPGHRQTYSVSGPVIDFSLPETADAA